MTDTRRKDGSVQAAACQTAPDLHLVLGNLQLQGRQLEDLALVESDEHRLRNSRATTATFLDPVQNDFVGLAHHLQGLAFMALLSSRRLLALHALALGLFAKVVARRWFAAVMTALCQTVFQCFESRPEFDNPLPQHDILS